MSDGNIPVLSVSAKSLAKTYEKGLIELFKHGCRVKTQYDKPEDPASIDATMSLTVMEPLSDPMIHKSFPGGISDLREYVYELEGLKDCVCRNENDPNDTRWEYLYSTRMTNYGTHLEKRTSKEAQESVLSGDIVARYEDGSVGVRKGHFDINQVEAVIEKLVKQPYTRQANIITWMPEMDLKAYDPPCFQSMWMRMLQNDEGKYVLNTDIRFRSNDAGKANFMNFFGFIQFIDHKIRMPIQEKMGQEIIFGRINWFADSWHIYGKDIESLNERFFNRISTTKFKDRVYNFHSKEIQEMYHENESEIIKKFDDIKKSFGIIN